MLLTLQCMEGPITRRRRPRHAPHLLTSDDISCPALLSGSHSSLSAASSQGVSKTARSACGVQRYKKASLCLFCPRGTVLSFSRSFSHAVLPPL